MVLYGYILRRKIKCEIATRCRQCLDPINVLADISACATIHPGKKVYIYSIGHTTNLHLLDVGKVFFRIGMSCVSVATQQF